MTLDLTQFHDTFFAESFEALDSMEAALLKLSAGEVDAELINTIFRVAHSIKGGARLSASTKWPASRTCSRRCSTSCAPASASVDPTLVDVLLRSGDADARHARRHAAQGSRSTSAASPRCTPSSSASWRAPAPRPPAAPQPAPPSTPRGRCRPAPAQTASGWRIQFVPGPKLLRHGNDPLRILRELATLGALRVSRRCQVASAAERARPRRLPPVAGTHRGQRRDRGSRHHARCSSGWKASAT